MPESLGGLGLTMSEQAVIYEEANRSIFGIAESLTRPDGPRGKTAGGPKTAGVPFAHSCIT